MDKPQSVHLIGIGGAGLSAIARLLLESGYRVSGSDRQASSLTNSLQEAGVKFFLGHAAEQVAGADLVVRSSAIPDDNVEVQAALKAGIPVLKRSEFLGYLMADHLVIAVAGTHGKTTTTAMIAWMLSALGEDPSYIIGGISYNLRSNAHAGSGSVFVVEADEYDRMFLGLRPQIAVVTSIEHDHPDCYPTPEDFFQAFFSFARCIKADGWLSACADDPGARRLLAEADGLPLSRVSYGLTEPSAEWRADELQGIPGSGYTFRAVFRSEGVGWLTLRVPGLHNVRNALAALSVAHCLSLPIQPACQALSEYQGTSRRFDVRGEASGVILIDDYAHHPTEIQATLAAARQRYPGRRVWAVWQPHTFSRTQSLFEAFVQAFHEADQVVVTEVYASRESSQMGTFSAKKVVSAMGQPKAHFIPELSQVVDFLTEQLKTGDIVIVMSAGDADQITAQLWNRLEERAK